MKSTSSFASCLFSGAILSLSVVLGGCGQTGPLYLPKAPAKSATSDSTSRPGVAPPTAPVPSTPPASQQ